MNTMHKYISVTLLLLFVFVPVFSLIAEQPPGVMGQPPAQPPGVIGNPPAGTVSLTNPIAANSFQELAAQVLKVVSSIGGILAVFFIIYSGFLFVTAGGNDTKRTDAKWALLYAIIGTAVLVGAQALALIIETTIKSLQ